MYGVEYLFFAKHNLSQELMRMRYAWKELLAVVPPELRSDVDKYAGILQEVRLRLDKPAELVTSMGRQWLDVNATDEILRFVINAASHYSPWAADTMANGYITAPGGLRIGLCGEVVTKEGCVTRMRRITSVNIRVARDLQGFADRLTISNNTLILGPPGSGKTTLLREICRNISRQERISVVDERKELFPDGFDRGLSLDVMSGCSKTEGIGMVLKTMGPDWIAVDEITSAEDCAALQSALWCGVRLIATAHASCPEDLMNRMVYRPLAQSGCFDTWIVMRPDKSWSIQRCRL
jgi:stage III sporulation protein AA